MVVLAFMCHTQVILIVPNLPESLTAKSVYYGHFFEVLLIIAPVEFSYCQIQVI